MDCYQGICSSRDSCHLGPRGDFKSTVAKMAKFRVGPPAPSAGHRADLPVLAGPLRHPGQAGVDKDLLGVWI